MNPWTTVRLEDKSLSRVDKLKLMQILAEGLAADEEAGIEAGRSYPVWSPERAFGATDEMLRALSSEKGPG